MRNPLVSIIIPFKNREPLLRECFESVRAQTYKELEVICINDASSEVDEASLTGYGRSIFPKFIYFKNEQTLGPGASRQRGLEDAGGDYLIYLDSDDILHPEMVKRSLAFMEANPHLAMVYVISREFLNAADLQASEKLKIRKRSNLGICTNLIEEILTHGRIWDTSACLWRRAAVKSFSPWLTQRHYEDYAYDCQLESAGQAAGHLAETLCYYRNHPAGIGKMADLSVYPQKAGMLLYVANDVERSPALSPAQKKKLSRLILKKFLDMEMVCGQPKFFRPERIENRLLRFAAEKPLLENKIAVKMMAAGLKWLPE